MNDLLESIKSERRQNLGKRFNLWIGAQWGYEKGSSFNKWRVDEVKAIREITESILLDSKNVYFTYKDNKLISSPDDILFGNTMHIDILVFKELLRDFRLKELLD
jgi:hypothetical protein